LLGNPQSTKTQVPVVQPPDAPPLPAKRIAAEMWAYWYSTDRRPLAPLPFAAARPKHTNYTLIIYFDSLGTVLDYDTEDIHT